MLKRQRLTITGRVQGVGFRPSIYRLATSLNLTGFVQNTTSGVMIEIEGLETELKRFDQQLSANFPPMALVQSVTATSIPAQASQQFQITASERSGQVFVGMPPDLATCPACVAELKDPSNRRFGYPFINCTNCGPRFSIIETLPYDRPHTSMAGFQLCPPCQHEYDDPTNRRFDAQPNACPTCGPQLTYLNQDHHLVQTVDPIAAAVHDLKSGKIVAIKGIGGYHLSCLASHEQAIARLRQRKHRPHKALAVMFQSLDEIDHYCELTTSARNWLSAPCAPIVILKKRQDRGLPSILAPDTFTIGAFLPYAPIHHLLLQHVSPLVMTSANLSDEPIVINEEELTNLLGPIADAALTHNRPILRRADDSVMMLVNQQPVVIRRSRGLVPNPITLPSAGPPLLVCGSDLKNSFGLTKHNQLYLSQHIGDLKDYPAQRFYQEQINDLKQLLQVAPEVIVHDLHPNYLSTHYANEQPMGSKIAVQHHHAHLASCMVEHGLSTPVIGVALDGNGYGADGRLWGGEFFINDLKTYHRRFHFEEMPLIGQAAAMVQPSRMAFAYLATLFPADQAADLTQRWLPDLDQHDQALFRQMLTKQLHTPWTSSAGRLFDAVSALLGFQGKITYEGQAAIQLETMCAPTCEERYQFDLTGDSISFHSMFRQLLIDKDKKTASAIIAAKFHHTVTAAVVAACQQCRNETDINQIVLSGGVFQNKFLLHLCIKGLNKQGFQVYSHQEIPPNDGGLAVGQAAVALASLSQE